MISSFITVATPSSKKGPSYNIVQSALQLRSPPFTTSRLAYCDRQRYSFYHSRKVAVRSIGTKLSVPPPRFIAMNTYERNMVDSTTTTTTTTTTTSGVVVPSNIVTETTASTSTVQQLQQQDVTRICRILCISDKDDINNMILYDHNNHTTTSTGTGTGTCSTTNEYEVVHVCSNITSEQDMQKLIDMIVQQHINTIFISDTSAQSMLSYILPRLNHSPIATSHHPSQQQQQHPIQWIHSRSAGIDSYLSNELIEWYQQQQPSSSSPPPPPPRLMTNAKGMFSSTLAEYSIGAMLYFCKDFHRLKRNQQQRQWEKYSVSELRGSTLGIIGYGDIGRATARLAKAFGMNVLALVRQSRSQSMPNDEYADVLIASDTVTTSTTTTTNNINNGGGGGGMNQIFAESDYVLCALPLTESTKGCIGAAQFALCQPNCVFINVGRGPIVDEDALILALQKKQIKGAALDVFTTEPLPTTSPLWDMTDNVLLSPHNMDQTDTFLIESTTFFVQEQIPRFVRGLPLLNHVNPTLGY